MCLLLPSRGGINADAGILVTLNLFQHLLRDRNKFGMTGN